MKVQNVILRLHEVQDPPSLEDVARMLSIPVGFFDATYGVQAEDRGGHRFTVHLLGEANVDPTKVEVFSNPGIGLQGSR